MLATFFVLPLYLQTVLGFDSLETGITILPLSLSLFVFALAGSALTARISPRKIVEAGLAVLASSFQSTVLADPALPAELKQAAATAADQSANFVTTAQVEQAALDAGVSAADTERLVSAYAASQLEALKAALASVAVFALIALVWVRHLPQLALPPGEDAEPA